MFAAFLLAGALALPSFADDTTPKPGGKPDDGQMMAQMMEMAKPGENHKLLEGLAGSWKYTVKFWMDPNGTPMESYGKAVTKPIMGGRYFQTDVIGKMQMPGADGKMMDTEFKGMSIDGYDNAKKIYVSSWVDNMGTGIMHSEGTYDPATKSLTYTAEEEPKPGMKTKVREVVKFADKDHHSFEFYEMRGDHEVKTMEITYVRK